MQQPQQVQTHHQVVEEIMPDQMSDEVTKEVINQFLPQRKRKPRQPKAPGKQQSHKMIKLEPQASGSEQNIITTMTSGGVTTMEQGAEMIIEEQEQVGEMVEQVVASGSVEEEQMKEEEEGNAGSAAPGTSPNKTPKTPKDKMSSEYLNMILNKTKSSFFNSLIFFCSRNQVQVTIGTTSYVSHLFIYN